MQKFMHIYVQLLRMLIVNYTQEQRRYIYHLWKKVNSLLKTAWFAIKNRRDRYLIHFIHIHSKGKPGTLSRGKGRPRASSSSDMISDHCKWRKTDTSLNPRRDFKQVCFFLCMRELCECCAAEKAPVYILIVNYSLHPPLLQISWTIFYRYTFSGRRQYAGDVLI